MLAFSGAQKGAVVLHNPYVISPLEKGTQSKVATAPLPSRGPKGGRYCYATPAFSRIPTKGQKIRRR